MLITIDNPQRLLRAEAPFDHHTTLPNVELVFEERRGILWKYIGAQATPYFSHALLDDIRQVQQRVQAHAELSARLGHGMAVRHVVFASRIPGVFSLGGDLSLFRRLIAARDRAGLRDYAKKATDAVCHHAFPAGTSMSFSLVQGVAMGGGFEAALAGNVLVAERGSRLGFPEVLFGLFPGMGAYTLLRRRVDAVTAERIILSARNYPAEELHELGIVDVLCEPGEGPDQIRSYISRQSGRPGSLAFRAALKRSRGDEREELYGICDSWVETALGLGEDCLRRIDRLVANQVRNFAHTAVKPDFVPVAAAV